MPWTPVVATSQSWTTVASSSQHWSTNSNTAQSWTTQAASGQAWLSSSLTLDPSSVVSRPVRIYPVTTDDAQRFQWEVRDEDPFYLADANLSVVIPDSAVTVRP